MALTGRPPKPAKLKLLAGNPGCRPIRREPEPNGAAVRPTFITGEAANEWDRVIAAMPPKFYGAADVPVLTVYCLAWVMYRNALGQVSQEGMTSLGSTGQKVAHPAIGVAAAHSAILLRAADRLGMSPAARARLGVEPEPATSSKFAGLIPGAPSLRLVDAVPPRPPRKPR